MEVLFYIAVVFLVVYFIKQKKKDENVMQELKKNSNYKSSAFKLIGNGSFNYEIVGESFYQKNIKKALNLSGGKSSQSFEVILKCENKNPHDKKAVGVYVNGLKVGNLSKGKARGHRDRLEQIGIPEEDTCCNATVWGGGNKKYYGIWLDYDPRKTKAHYKNQ